MAESASGEKDRLSTREPPFETSELDRAIAAFFKTPLDGESELTVGRCQWGVYAFFDYDSEPIYVGQTNERVSSRIRRHLTNRRTDAVAMGVLDPFEVHSIAVWPLPEYQELDKQSNKAGFTKAVAHLNDLEASVYQHCVAHSKFKAVLNEKLPVAKSPVTPPKSYSGVIITADVMKLRDHPDIRLARRASTIARLALIISEREIQPGLRRTLLVQAKRLEWLADQRLAVFDKEIGSAPEPEND